MAFDTSQFRNGLKLEIDGEPYVMTYFQHVKPGKGGAFVRTTLKNVRTGAVVEKTFRAGEKMERAVIDKREMQYLYRDGADFVFMDNESYDQLTVPPTSLAGAASYIVDGSTVVLQMYGDEIVGSDLPAAVELNVAETEPGIQGDRVSGARKPATLETGLTVQVPLFVNPGDRIKVDTRTAEYITRA
jgi:elongation factor P